MTKLSPAASRHFDLLRDAVVAHAGDGPILMGGLGEGILPQLLPEREFTVIEHDERWQVRLPNVTTLYQDFYDIALWPDKRWAIIVDDTSTKLWKTPLLTDTARVTQSSVMLRKLFTGVPILRVEYCASFPCVGIWRMM